MPTYEYECKTCSHSFEAFQAMSDLPIKDCPSCGKEVRRLIFGGAGVIFKGSGFYVTDKGGAKSGKSSGSAGSTGNNANSSNATGSEKSPCSGCPSGGEAGKCPVASAEKAKPEPKSA